MTDRQRLISDTYTAFRKIRGRLRHEVARELAGEAGGSNGRERETAANP